MPPHIEILYEDDECMVINKPAGLAVQGGAGVHTSLDSMLARAYTPRPLLVHRLDRDTSGLILVARNKSAAARFSRLLGQDAPAGASVAKQYVAACAGAPENAEGLIRIGLDVHGKQKNCETRYATLHSAPLPPPMPLAAPESATEGGSGRLPESCPAIFSVLELELASGRMHQIRRHLALIGTPVLGDDKYGDFSLNKALAKTMKLKRLLLHSFRLRIPPGLGVPPLDIRAPLPAHFTAFLEQAGCGAESLPGYIASTVH